jgi:hypothetical protein
MEAVEQREAAITVPVWAVVLAALAAMGIVTMLMAQTSQLASAGNVLHEFVHDARHFIGVPCH